MDNPSRYLRLAPTKTKSIKTIPENRALETFLWVQDDWKVQERGTKIADPEQRIKELSLELDLLRTERDRLNEESLVWAEKRNGLHEEVKKMRWEAKSLKERRDGLNGEVQRLKALREETWRAYRGKIDRLKSLRQRIREAAANRPSRSSQSIEGEIERIEWKIQTESPSLAEERRLVERVKTLESQLEVYREIEGIEDEMAKLENEAKTLKDQIANHRDRVSEIAKQSQEFHEKMVGRLERARKLKAEADEMHGKYIEYKGRAKTLHLKYVEMLGHVKALRGAIREKEEEERAKQQADLRKKLEEEALAKLKRGERLTFEEFKILAEQGKI
jgi:uncharacterized coiled-coil DUF342 family protein